MEYKNKSYEELCECLWNAKSAKEVRKIHKELKKYGNGALFEDRYPNFPTVVSIAALVLCLIAELLNITLLLI